MPIRPIVFRALHELAADEGFEVEVQGNSMLPLIPPGARLVVRASPRYRIGDLLVFRDGARQLVVHRLLGMRRHGGRTCFLLRGDAAPRADGLVVPEDVLGKVCGGDVAAAAISIPLSTRLWAALRCLGHQWNRLTRRFA